MYVADRRISSSQRNSKGIALVGATAIAAASIGLMPQVAQLPDPVKVSTAATQLVAQVNPIETLMEALQATAANVQTVANNWQARPAPLMQQVAANWLNYAQIVTKSLTSEITTIDRIGGQLTDPAFIQAFISNIQQGNIQVAWNSIHSKLVAAGFLLIAPLTNMATIPAYMLTNMAAAVKVLASSGLSAIGTAALSAFLGTGAAFAEGLQGAVDSAKEGDALGALENVANIPGLLVKDVLNNPTGGLLSPTGLLGQLTTRIPQLIAAGIVAPGAQNIFKGGTLDAGFASLSDSVDKLVAAIGAGLGIPAGAAATVNTVSAPKALTAKAPVTKAASDPASVPSLTTSATNAVTLAVGADTDTDTVPRVAVKAPAAEVDSPSVSPVRSALKTRTSAPQPGKVAAKLRAKVAAKVGERAGSSAPDASTKKPGGTRKASASRDG
ncbi:hypothetical protein [Mycolicibacterium septicum]|uniref:hypothetical protein n=1 Tax=Mycolicibacterium septicum TaxID=98668 RepID=UPI001AFC8645|nr:hypothetical protein [Mycolicibacterium septicum]QRY52544.1 hypothetical protein JVX95_03950 [Mycolicibacterium septicum]